MKKSMLAIVALLASSSALASSGSGTVLSYNVGLDGYAEFGMTVPLPGTCSYFTNQFRFDATTPEGKNLLLTVIAAKTTGLTLLVWYTDSTAPGTNHNNGCVYSTMADVTNVGLQ